MREHKIIRIARMEQLIRQYGDRARVAVICRQLRREGLGLREATVVGALYGKRASHYDLGLLRRRVVRKCGPVETGIISKALRAVGLSCHPCTARRIRRQLFGGAQCKSPV